ncbi:MAG TPA: hypothetical protein VMW16_14495 [Sedimentisphaerales bacterium]|nr:hypothetical protein [Sedimentisphaerales bacterium]
MPTPETKTVLITVKAPPNPSEQHQEINCCAGIDLSTGTWIRLYPIPFRLLDDDKKFPKYSIISVNCQRPLRDKRIESYKVDQDSIKILRHVGTQNKWAERKKIVLPALSPSFCTILDEVAGNKSLGIFKPTDIEFEIKKAVPKDEKKRRAAYDQYRLFDKGLKPVEQIPLSFCYRFKCHNSPKCPRHKLMIHDWELTETYRRWRHKYTAQALLFKIREKWFDDLCGSTKDAYFYVGNMWQRPKQFMVLGVFYPPKSPPSLFKDEI